MLLTAARLRVSPRSEQDECSGIAVDPSSSTDLSNFTIPEEAGERERLKMLPEHSTVVARFAVQSLATSNTGKHESTLGLTLAFC